MRSKSIRPSFPHFNLLVSDLFLFLGGDMVLSRCSFGIHILGEVFNGHPTYVCPYQEYMSGLLNYPQSQFFPHNYN